VNKHDTIVSYEDIESILDEWFADYSINGKINVAKLYARIESVCEKNLRYFLDNEVNDDV
jgi:hypothetical protein